MHISGALKQDSDGTKQDFDRLTSVGIPVRLTNNIIKLIQRFGYDISFGRMDIARELDITKSPASEFLNKMLTVGAIVPATDVGKGKYRFNSAFLSKILHNSEAQRYYFLGKERINGFI